MALVPLALALGLAACGSDTAAKTSGTADAATASVPTSVPAGTTLRVADQLQALETILGAAGENSHWPFTIQWSNFVGGPPMLQAFEGGSVDVGFVATTPTIFAQAAGQKVVAVAAWGPAHSPDELVTAPGESIGTWAALKGKKVAYQQGTVEEAVLLAGLHSAGLTLQDITTVNVPTTEIAATLQGHSADAGILVQPLTAAYLLQDPTAKVVEPGGSGYSARLDYVIASGATLQDPAKEAALGVFLTRLVKAVHWVDTHQAQWVQIEYVQQYKVPAAEGQQLLDQAGQSRFVPIGSSLYAAQQAQADLFTANGEIPEHVDVAGEFDSRFNSIVEEASKS